MNAIFTADGRLTVKLSAQGYFLGQKVFTYITEAKEWFQSEAPLSILWYYVIITMATLLLAPYGPFCIAIGFIFGLWTGLLIQIGALFISNVVIFAVGRYLLRDKVCVLTVYACVCVYTHTHIHTHTSCVYISVCVCFCKSVCV
jgi:uncharacterized membrane protein YdjX (TVP38/TMEM64 family)